MAGEVKLEVGRDIVDSIVNAHIQTAIVMELKKNSEELITKMIQSALNEKVSENGHKSNYSSDNKYPFLEVLCKQAIQEVTKKALKQWVEENKDKLEKSFQNEMKKQEKPLVKSFMNAILDSASSSWRMNVTISDSKKE